MCKLEEWWTNDIFWYSSTSQVLFVGLGLRKCCNYNQNKPVKVDWHNTRMHIAVASPMSIGQTERQADERKGRHNMERSTNWWLWHLQRKKVAQRATKRGNTRAGAITAAAAHWSDDLSSPMQTVAASKSRKGTPIFRQCYSSIKF